MNSWSEVACEAGDSDSESSSRRSASNLSSSSQAGAKDAFHTLRRPKVEPFSSHGVPRLDFGPFWPEVHLEWRLKGRPRLPRDLQVPSRASKASCS